ncbi:UNVERIFIED_CONTAM: hypothetical protein FKN15_029598 [Acipenser sinensis]
MLGARTSTLYASALRRSVHAPRRSTLRRFDARCTHLDDRRFSTRRSVHAPRRSTLRRFDARCTHLDARRFGASTLGALTSTIDASALDARCTHLDALRFGASTLGARTSTLDASALRRSVHAPRRSTLRRIDARCTHLDALRFGALTLGARTSTLDASALRRSVHAPRRSTLRRFDARCTHLNALRLFCVLLQRPKKKKNSHSLHRGRVPPTLKSPAPSVPVIRRSRSGAFGVSTSALGAALRRSVQRFCAWCLVLCTWDSMLDARCMHLDARRFGASRLGARTSTLDSRCTHLDARRSVHAPRRLTLRRFDARCTHLDDRRFGTRRSVHAPRRSTLRRFDARCTHLNARRFGASTLGACSSTLYASALRRSVHAPQRSTLRRFDARCTHLDALRFGASTLRRSVHAARRSTLRRFDARCTHLDDRRFGARRSVSRRFNARYMHLDARRFGTRRSVHTPQAIMSGFHHCVTCQAKLPANYPHEDCVACLGPEHAASALADRSFCALCANFQPRTLRQRARKAVGKHSPSSGSSFTLSVPPSSTATPPVTLRVSKSHSQLTAGQRSPDRRHQGCSRSPSFRPRGSSPRRERSRRSRSRSLSPRRRGCSRSPRRDRHVRDKSGMAELTAKMSQFMEVMMGQQSLLMSLTSRASPAEPLASQPALQPQSLAVPVVQQPQGLWDVDAISWDASEGEPLLDEESFEAELASQHSEHDSEPEALDTSDPLWSLLERATRHLGIDWPVVELPRRSLFELPSVWSPLPRPLPAFLDFIKEVQSTWGSPASSPATSRKASLVKDLPEHPSASLRAELVLVTQLLVKIAQLNALVQGRSIASLVVTRRQLWLSQARVHELDKAPLLNVPIMPGHTFGKAVEEMLQRSVKDREASQQMAKMWPHKPFQPRRQQEHQWRRAPPRHQPRPGGTKTSPSSTAAHGQPPFSRPQRGGWRPRGGGRPRPLGSGQPPRERAQPKQP